MVPSLPPSVAVARAGHEGILSTPTSTKTEDRQGRSAPANLQSVLTSTAIQFDPATVPRCRSLPANPCSDFGSSGPYFENRLIDVSIIDTWNGSSESLKIAAMAEAYEINFQRTISITLAQYV